MSSSHITLTQLTQFVSKITVGGSVDENADDILKQWYEAILYHCKREAKSITDIVAIAKRHNIFDEKEISTDNYAKQVNRIALFLSMNKREEIPGLLSVEEKRNLGKIQIEKTANFISASETEHFREEWEMLGDIHEDIAPGSFHLRSFEPERKRKKTG